MDTWLSESPRDYFATGGWIPPFDAEPYSLRVFLPHTRSLTYRVALFTALRD